MKTLALQQVSSDYAQRNSRRTLEKAIGLKHIRNHIATPLLASLEKSCSNGRIYIWGAKAERSPQTSKMLRRETLFLFRRGTQIFKYGVMIEKDHNAALAEELWGPDDDGELWSTIFFFARLNDRGISAPEINEMLGRRENYLWQGLVGLFMKESPENDDFFRKELEGL